MPRGGALPGPGGRAAHLAVDDFLIGKDGAEAGAPVDADLGLEGEVFLEELQEDPLRPLDVADVWARARQGGMGDRWVCVWWRAHGVAVEAPLRAPTRETTRDGAGGARRPERMARVRARLASPVVASSRSQSYEKPSERSCRLKLAMFCLVVASGCVPVLMACCSAGRPKASQPIGCSTSKSHIRQYRAMMSDAVYPSGWPTCSPAPDGYGNMSSTYFFCLPSRRRAAKTRCCSQ